MKQRSIRNICKRFFLWAALVAGGTTFMLGNSNVIVDTFEISSVEAQNTPNAANTAAWQAVQEDSALKDFVWFFEMLLNALYLICWVFLWIAWLSMDNSLVYWSIFNLDVALFSFWNIMKNFANYALWFVFLFGVLASFFNLASDKFSPTKMLPKLLIWWVLVQASWFLVAALIDLSTIMTYALGGLPLNAIKWSELGSQKMLGVVTKMNLSDISNVKDSMKYASYYTNWANPPVFYPGCIEQNGALYGKESDSTTGKQYAEAYKDYIAKLNQVVSWNNNWSTLDDWFCAISATTLVKVDKVIMDRYSYAWNRLFVDAAKAWKKELDDKWKISLDGLMDAGTTGPLMTLYVSIMNMSWFLSKSTGKDMASVSVEFLMTAIIALAMIVPLLTLAVVLLVRAVVLWLIIWFSPLLVLSEVFDFKLGWEKLQLKSILWLIFLPVSAVFAISLSVVFLTLVKWMINLYPEEGAPNNQQNVQDALGFAKNGDCTSYMNMYTVCPTKSTTQPELTSSNFWDIIPWLFMNLLSIGLMWAVVFTALKTSKVTDWIVSSIEGFSKWILWSVPFVPVPWVWAMSVGWLKQSGSYIKWLPDRIQQNQFADIEPRLKGLTWGLTWAYKEPVRIAWEIKGWSADAAAATRFNNELLGGMKSSWAGVNNIDDFSAAFAKAYEGAWFNPSNISSYRTSKELVRSKEFAQYMYGFAWYKSADEIAKVLYPTSTSNQADFINEFKRGEADLKTAANVTSMATIWTKSWYFDKDTNTIYLYEGDKISTFRLGSRTDLTKIDPTKFTAADIALTDIPNGLSNEGYAALIGYFNTMGHKVAWAAGAGPNPTQAVTLTGWWTKTITYDRGTSKFNM